MFNLEDKLLPTPDRHTVRRDSLAAALVLLLAVPLLGGWFARTGSAIQEIVRCRQALAPDGARPNSQADPLRDRLATAELALQQQWQDLSSRAFSPLLLAAIGFALALRRGAVDLSVWVTGGVGGLLAASFLHLPWAPIHTTPWAPLLAIPLAAGAGAVIGLANGMLVARRRVPAPLATLAVAGALLLILRLTGCPDSIPVAELAFDKVSEATGLPLWMFRMLAVGLLGALVLIVALAFGGEHHRLRPPQTLMLALCASGALAGLAGALRLLDTSVAFRPRLVEDLRIPAAALLAGAAVFAGHGRTLVTCLFVPAGVILAGEWMLHVYDWQVGGYHLQLLALVAMTAGTHAALSAALAAAGPRRPVAWLGLAACASGMVLLTYSGGTDRSAAATLSFLVAGVLLWSLGLAGALWCRHTNAGLSHPVEGERD